MGRIRGIIDGIGKYFPGDIRKRKNYYLTFTAIFLIMVLLAFGWIFFSGRTLIWEVDGVQQHYKAYVYWGQYLRNFFRTLFTDHRLSFQEWDFALGEGNDILHTLQFYVIGDPFAFLSVCVPTAYMHIFYNFMMLFRLYLAGITFSAMCAYVRPQGDPCGRMTGTVCYVFSCWAINSVVKHPFFLNPLVFFPLIILGVEKILNGERKRTFIMAVFLSALSNFYFFYQTVIHTVIYVVVRLILRYRKEIKQLLVKLLWIFLSAVMGALMAMAILLPTVFVYIADTRLDMGIPFSWIYESSYYTAIPGVIFGGQNAVDWMCVGMAGIGVISVLLLFMKKGNLLLKVFLLLSALIFSIPALGQILNGMSYITNRWSWVFNLLIAFIVVVMWEGLMGIDRKEFRRVLVGLVVCMVLICVFPDSRTKEAFMGIACAFLLMFFVFPEGDEEGKPRRNGKWKKTAIFLVTGANVFLVLFFFNATTERGWAEELTEAREVDDTAETKVIKAQAELDGVTTFYRYAGGKSYNVHTMGGLSNPGYYWSLTNPAVSDYIRQMGMTDNVIYKNWGNDNMTGVLAGSAVRYLLVSGEVDEENPEGTVNIPYGFDVLGQKYYNQSTLDEIKKGSKEELGHALTEEQSAYIDTTYGDPYLLLRNKYPLPLGYVTSNVISEDVWSRYSPVEKQQAMLQGVLLQDGMNGTLVPDMDIIELNYKDMNFSPEVTMTENSFVVTKKGGAIKLEIDRIPDADLYIEFKGLKYQGYPQKELYLGSEDKDPRGLYTKAAYDALPENYKDRLDTEEGKWGSPETASARINILTSGKNTGRIALLTPRARNYSDIKDIAVNLGYDKKGAQRLRLTFTEVGQYTFDSFRIIAVPMKNFGNRVEELKANSMRNEQITEDMVTGSVTVPEQGGILRLAIPYAKGWKAYVDGKEADILHADIKYMGIYLDAGDHDIRLVYQTPFVREGLMISGGAILLFLLGITVLPWLGKMIRGRKKPLQEEI